MAVQILWQFALIEPRVPEQELELGLADGGVTQQCALGLMF